MRVGYHGNHRAANGTPKVEQTDALLFLEVFQQPRLKGKIKTFIGKGQLLRRIDKTHIKGDAEHFRCAPRQGDARLRVVDRRRAAPGQRKRQRCLAAAAADLQHTVSRLRHLDHLAAPRSEPIVFHKINDPF